MSTHFRPRPPSVPTSPVRPSTAHSTIRAVTPSPPHDLPRPKSAHAINSPDLTTFASYVLKSDDSKMFSNTPPTDRPASALRRSGARTSRSVSPVKSRMSHSTSPVKMRREKSPTKTQPLKTPEGRQDEKSEQAAIQEEQGSNSSSDEDITCPDTPTPMTREQKRSAYLPLGQPIPLTLPAPTFPPPIHTTTNVSSPTYNPSPTSPTRPPPSIPRESSSRIPNPNPDRISVSGASNVTAITGLSVASKASRASQASKNSVFSTPGRDELERKKALVEVDDGPFGRAVSVADLREERSRAVGGGRGEQQRRRWNGGEGDGKKKGKRGGCMGWDGKGCGCVVM